MEIFLKSTIHRVKHSNSLRFYSYYSKVILHSIFTIDLPARRSSDSEHSISRLSLHFCKKINPLIQSHALKILQLKKSYSKNEVQDMLLKSETTKICR